MRFFLAGGAGFIGTRLTRRLLEEGHRVVVFDNLATGTTPDEHEHLTFVKGDIAYSHMYPTMKDCDVVVNLACMDMADAIHDQRKALAVNVMGTLNLLMAAKLLCRRFVQISSCSVYGEQDRTGPIPEDAPLRPFTPYAAEKLAGEALVRAYHTHGWVDGTIIRPSNVYGPGQKPPKHKGVVGLFIRRKIEKQKADIYGDFRRDFTYVDDVVDGIVRACLRGDIGPYNIAWGVGTSIRDLAQLIGVETRDAEPRPIDLVTSRTLDIMKAQKEIGYDPKTSLPAGLAKHEAWMRGDL